MTIINETTRVSLQVGQVVAILVAIVGGASWASGIEAKADAAKADASAMRVELASVRGELTRQRELIATIQGDTRAILQLIKLRGNP